MRKYEKEILRSQLDAEADELKKLRLIYAQAADDVKKKIKLQNGKMMMFLKNWDSLDEEQKSMFQSQVYQRKFQKQLDNQLREALEKLNTKQYKNVNEYLADCYKNGATSAAYQMHKQGIPLITPLDHKAIYEASKLDAPISKRLYGEYTNQLKKDIQGEISRGIATSSSYAEIARNIDNKAKIGFNKAMRIARTEGGKIRNTAEYNAALEAKKAGADIVLQWSAALDKRTRPSHAIVDGETVEIGEKFSNGLLHPCDPSGAAAEVINCRCVALQRARWALDEDELQILKDRAAYYGIDKTKNFEEFKQKYLKISQTTLTFEEEKAIYDYMSAKSYVVNDKLRNNEKLTPEEVEFTTNLDNALNKMPKHKGHLQRSLYFSDQDAVKAFLALHVIGEPIKYKEYLSTTKGETYNPDGQVQIYIQDSENGNDISEFNGGEFEVLYSRNSEFKVINMVEQDGVHYILLKEKEKENE